MQEEFYLEENVAKAISIDEFSGDSLTTSLVDDVFFILQKVGRRSLATASVQCICAVLTQLNSLLASDLRLALDSRWKVRSSSGKCTFNAIEHGSWPQSTVCSSFVHAEAGV